MCKNQIPSLEDAIERARRGDFKEYWLQVYVKENYQKLGFESIEGPFDRGYDFRAVFDGERVVVEAETKARNFVYHNHNHHEVDFLIVLNNNQNGVVKKMQSEEWTKLLPKTIIEVDHEDFIKSTHERRKSIAIRKRREEEQYGEFVIDNFPFIRMKSSFANIWNDIVDDVPMEGTPEFYLFDEALSVTAVEYLKFYNVDYNQLKSGHFLTKIDSLAYDLVKFGKKIEDFSEEDKELISTWLEILHYNYIARL